MGTSCLADWCCRLQGSQQNDPINASHSIFHGVFHTVKATQHGGGLKHSSRLNSLHLATQVCDFFRDRILSASFGVQPRRAARVYILGSVSGACVTNHSQGSVSRLDLGGLVTFGFQEHNYPIMMIISLLNLLFNIF